MPYRDTKGSQARAADARYRAKNRPQLRAYQRIYQRKRHKILKKERQAFIEAYKALHPCVDCGETNPLLLEFDHRDHRTKKFRISAMVSRGNLSIAMLEKEIAKCDIRCVKCHRKKTASERHLWCRVQLKSPEIPCQPTLFD